jgi:predicted SAM-dependent methyltransferase
VNHPSVSIVIPTLQGMKGMLRSCLESIQSYTALDDVEVIVVANGAGKDVLSFVRSLGDSFRCLWFEEGLGYTKAANAGIQAAYGDFIVLLNDDCILLHQEQNTWLDWLKKSFEEDEHIGITGCHSLVDPNTSYEFIVFFCTMLRRTMLREIGLLDEIFNPGAGEDCDLCIRAEKAGWVVKVVDKTTFAEGAPFMVGSFPIYHKAEDTFDKYPHWQDIFDRNSETLRKRYVLKEDVPPQVPKLEERTPWPTPLKLNVGCGEMLLPGFMNVDRYNKAADFDWDVACLPLPSNCVDEIYASHVIEHFHFFEAIEVLQEWKRVLKKGGKLVLETPDFLASCHKFANASEEDRIGMYSHFFSEPWIDGQWHKFLYTPTQMRWTLQELKFNNIHQEPALRYTGREDICMKFVVEK